MKVFISHTSADKESATVIGERLLHHGVDVWLDSWEMYPGDSLYDKIEKGMKEVDAFIILLSQASLESSWVRDEMKIALERRRREPSFRIVPILLEKVDPPSFLLDIIYIEWMDKTDESLHSLLRALKKIDLKPPNPVEIRGRPSLELRKVDYRIQFHGERGSQAKFSEAYTALALAPLDRIDRRMSFAGNILSTSSDVFQIERSILNPQLEKWSLVSNPPIPAEKEFTYNVAYEIANCFDADEETWFYNIETPTDKIRAEFDFTLSTPITDIKVFHTVGLTRHEEPIPFRRDGQRFVWEKLFPAYKDTYEFVFHWEK